jgi:penicillin-insensitive murein endopeptidase
MGRAAMQERAFDPQLVNNLLKNRLSRGTPTDPAPAERSLARAAAACALVALLAGGATSAWAQDTAAEEAAHRAAVLARLPQDAAKRVFGLATSPAPGSAPGSGPGSAMAIGSYTRGCLAGATALPADGPHWQVMRPSRDRAWGHPVLIGFLERLAVTAAGTAAGAARWPGLLIGDIGQPRGGPMLTGHASHQIGLDADLWLTAMPDRRLSATERDQMPATNLVAANGDDVDPEVWRPAHRKLLEEAARSPGVARIFVNPAIKRALCRDAGADRDWLRRIRPWWGHNYHFHLRLGCPRGDSECQGQPAPLAGDGCGAELDWWFTLEARHPKPAPPERPLRVVDLPAGCPALVP